MVGSTQENANVCKNMERGTISIVIIEMQVKTITNYIFSLNLPDWGTKCLND